MLSRHSDDLLTAYTAYIAHIYFGKRGEKFEIAGKDIHHGAIEGNLQVMGKPATISKVITTPTS